MGSEMCIRDRNKSLVELREICSSNTDEIANNSGANEALGHSKIKIVLLFSSMEAWIDLCTRQCSSVFRLAETINIRLAWGLRNTLFAVATTAWMPLVNSFEGALASDKITKKTRAKLELSHNREESLNQKEEVIKNLKASFLKEMEISRSKLSAHEENVKEREDELERSNAAFQKQTKTSRLEPSPI